MEVIINTQKCPFVNDEPWKATRSSWSNFKAKKKNKQLYALPFRKQFKRSERKNHDIFYLIKISFYIEDFYVKFSNEQCATNLYEVGK